jgi:hypothetical protein
MQMDSDGVIQKVTFYENGVPVNTDFFYPYEFGWSPGPPGYYDLYFEVTDNKGNKTVSDIMRREVFYTNPPIIEFEPAIQGRISTIGLIQNESFVLGPVTNFLSDGNGYHSAPRVIFNDE